MEIILIDDDSEEAELFGDALLEIDSNIKFRSFTEGLEALEFLIKCDQTDVIVFLDINMPRTTGKQLLKTIRQTAALKNLAVILYSTSISKRDIEDTQIFNVKSYLEKPEDFRSLVEKIRNAIYI